MANDVRFWDRDKWGDKAQFEVVEFFHSRIGALFRERVRESGKSWEEAVYDTSLAVTREDIEQIEKELLDTGYRYQFSAQISLVEDPEKYAATAGKGDVSGEDLLAEATEGGETTVEGGRTVVGTGQNVTRMPENVSGTVRFISTTETVMDMLVNGVPEETIAVIDDSGGTLTAPIIEGFTGILCLGGTVRSHLGILAREYGIPCLMDTQLSNVQEGNRVEIEYTAAPPSATSEGLDASAARAHVWKLG